MNIESFAQIIPGFAFRDAIQESPNGKVFVVQASNIDGRSLSVNPDTCKRTEDAPMRSGSFLNPNDVLISARGSASAGFKAAVFRGHKSPVIASATVYILRINANSFILPEYLALYINSKEGQSQLARLLVGGVTRSVRRKDIEGFDVPIPEVVTQSNLVKLSINIQQQQQLLKQKTSLGESILNGAIHLAIRSN